MSSSPSLNIPLLSENQAAKEATINTAFLRYEGATQRSFSPVFTANARTLTNTEFTSYFCFRVENLTAAGTLTIPQEIVTGSPAERFFIVRNLSDYALTITGSASGSLVLDPQSMKFVYSSGTVIESVSVIQEIEGTLDILSDVTTTGATNGQFLKYDSGTGLWSPATVSDIKTFTGLTDTPHGYTGMAGLGLRVKATEDGLEFFEIGSGGSGSLPPIVAGDAGKILAVKSTEDGTEWITAPTGGSGGGDGSGSAASPARHWRITLTEVESTIRSGIGEIKWLDGAGTNLATGGTPSASATGFSNNGPEKAFDGSTSSYWYATGTTGQWIAYDFGADVLPASVSIQAGSAGDYAPTKFTVESSSDGVEWTQVGGVTNAGTWTTTTPARVFPVPITVLTEVPPDGLTYVRRGDEWVEHQDVFVPIVEASSSVSINAGHNGKTLVCRSSASTLNILNNGTMPIGSKVDIIAMAVGDATVTVAPGGGVTLVSATGTFTLRTQYSQATLIKIASAEWVLYGDLT